MIRCSPNPYHAKGFAYDWRNDGYRAAWRSSLLLWQTLFMYERKERVQARPFTIDYGMGHAGDGLVHLYAKADDDFKREAAAKLEAFIASKRQSENTSTGSNNWVN